MGKDNVTLYTWTEDEHRKGANEIASAVYDRLQTTIFSQNINTIRFVADGCGAQNKNSIMIGMAATWLSREIYIPYTWGIGNTNSFHLTESLDL